MAGEQGAGSEDVGLAVFLRLDRAELDGTKLVLRATPHAVRQQRRTSSDVPLGYLYEPADTGAPDADMQLTAGHFDEDGQVWVFSGEISGIAGLTEPLGDADHHPNRQ